MNENRNPVPAGVYDCRLVSATRSQKKNLASHFVLSLRIIPQDSGVESPCEYFAELPLVYAANIECGFYDKETNTNVKRKATTADTMKAIEYAKKCIPEWADYIAGLPDDAPFATAFEWFNDIPDGVIVRANVKAPREYDGKLYYEATIYERGGVGAVTDAGDFMSAFGKSLKAAGFKVGGGAGGAKVDAAKKPTAPAASPSVPKPPKPPAAAKPGPKKYTHEEAWEAYQKFCLAEDPNGANYWPRVERITGKTAANYKDFTDEDWRKCIEDFSSNF